MSKLGAFMILVIWEREGLSNFGGAHLSLAPFQTVAHERVALPIPERNRVRRRDECLFVGLKGHQSTAWGNAPGLEIVPIFPHLSLPRAAPARVAGGGGAREREVEYRWVLRRPGALPQARLLLALQAV